MAGTTEGDGSQARQAPKALDLAAAQDIFSPTNLQALIEAVGPELARGGRSLVYMLPASGRIGHMTLEPFYLSHLYGKSHDRILVLIHDHRFMPHSTGVRRLLEPLVRFVETRNRKLVMMGHFTAKALDIGPMTWAVLSPGALFRAFCLYLEAGGTITHAAPPADLSAEAEARLGEMGAADGAPVVALHVRDTGYMPEMPYHSFRTARIADYRPAVEHLLAKGYRVFRIGDRTSARLDFGHERLVDLPFHPLYSDILDVHVLAKARFAITSASGPEAVARVLGTPMVLVNGYAQHNHWLNPHDLLLFKRYRDVADGRLLPYDEILARNLFVVATSDGFEKAGIRLEDNLPEEILAAVEEMEARLAGTFPVDSALDARFAEISARHLARMRSSPFPGLEADIENDVFGYALPWTRHCQSFAKANPWFLGLG